MKNNLTGGSNYMTNRQKYAQVFMDSFSIEEGALNDELVYNSILAWDSVGHMQMIAALEEAFDIMMDTDDIIDFSSYNKGVEILEKYEIRL
jgi:acyl carrier protein